MSYLDEVRRVIVKKIIGRSCVSVVKPVFS